MDRDGFERAVAAAVRAPSVHNTQPWLFHHDGDTVEVVIDRSRTLPAEDPAGRELLISCGAALRHLHLALRVAGHEPRVELLPGGDVVARLQLGDRRPATLPESELYAAIWTRRSRRERFADGRVPSALLARCRTVAEADGCHLDLLDADDALLLATLGDRAEQLMASDPDRHAEQLQWTGPQGVPASDPAVRGSDVPLRFFGDEGPITGSEPPVPEHPVLAVLGTPSDGPHDWVTCGWALCDVLLTLEASGAATSLLTQVMEVPALRAQLRGGLGWQGAPQLVLRIGLPGPGEAARSGRRSVAEVLL